MKHMKLFPKTLLYLLSMLGIVILIAHLSLYWFLPSFYLNNMEQDFDNQVAVLEELLQKVDIAAAPSLLETYASRNQMSIAATINGQTNLYPHQGEQANQILIFSDVNTDTILNMGNVADVESLLVRSRTVLSKDQQQIHLQLTMSTQPVKKTKAVLLSILPITIGISVLFALLFAWGYSRKITAPVLDMVQKTKDMANLKQDALVPVDSNDEIGLLGTQMNQVYGQLWHTIAALEQENCYIAQIEEDKLNFLRAASHELKTPLASLRILLENMQYNIGKYKDHSTYLAVSIEIVDQLSSMIQDMLSSSRLPNGSQASEMQTFTIKPELDTVLQQYRILGKAKQLTITIDIPDTLQCTMNRSLFQRVWSNLISNAIQYSTPGGSVHIQGTEHILSITNTCPPIPQEQLSHIFAPFYRLPASTGQDELLQNKGNGLGLYLVKEILTASHITYQFVPCTDGMCFTMQLTE